MCGGLPLDCWVLSFSRWEGHASGGWGWFIAGRRSRQAQLLLWEAEGRGEKEGFSPAREIRRQTFHSQLSPRGEEVEEASVHVPVPGHSTGKAQEKTQTKIICA